MKKKVLKLVAGATLVAAMVVGMEINNANNKSSLKVENMEALACYNLEIDGVDWGECCYPWTSTCHVFSIGETCSGKWYF
jgi:hypothetical protein